MQKDVKEKPSREDAHSEGEKRRQRESAGERGAGEHQRRGECRRAALGKGGSASERPQKEKGGGAGEHPQEKEECRRAHGEVKPRSLMQLKVTRFAWSARCPVEDNYGSGSN